MAIQSVRMVAIRKICHDQKRDLMRIGVLLVINDLLFV